jgi:hypothetical protein
MKAYLQLTDNDINDKPIVTARGAAAGISLSYVTRDGIPAVFFESEPMPASGVIVAPPGMIVCSTLHPDGTLFVIDSDGQAQRLPLRVLSEREYVQYVHLKESLRAEAI